MWSTSSWTAPPFAVEPIFRIDFLGPANNSLTMGEIMANLKAVDRIQLATAVRIFHALVLVLIAWTPCQASDASSPADVGASDEYRLAPGDTLSITVFDQAELSGNFIISGDGQVLLPLAGGVPVADLNL